MTDQQEIQQIHLSQLRISPRNVRRTSPSAIDELAASISAESILNNLVVTEAEDGVFEVEDGGRRLQALQLLERDGRLTDQLASVPCKVVALDNAREASLTTAIHRQALHPADEFTAFQQLLDDGKSIEEIAERFGKTTLHIRQRLRLANVKPELFELYRAGEMSLDQLTALASTHNHELQRQAWETARGDWEQTPRHLRDYIGRESVRSDQPLPQFVGLEAYQAAGGTVRTDLFTDDVWLTDLALLDTLAMDKLEARAEELRQEGWSWVEVRLQKDYAELNAYLQARVSHEQVREVYASKEDEDRDAVISARIQEIEDIDADELEAEEQAALENELSLLDDEAAEITDRKKDVFAPELMATTGVYLYISQDDGCLKAEYARLKPDQPQTKAAGAGKSASKPATKKPALSDAIRSTLSAHRSEVARLHVVKDHTLAWCVLLEQLLISHWPNSYGENGLHVSFGNHIDANKDADIHKAITAAITQSMAIIKTVPRKDTLTFLLKQTDPWRLELQAALVAAHFSGITPRENGHDGVSAIHRITKFDMADHWSAGNDDFLSRIHADLVAEAVTEAKGKDAAATLNGLKKQERAATAAKLLAGTGWLPKPLRGPDYSKKAASDETKASKPTKAAQKKPVKKAAKKAHAKKVAKVPAKKKVRKA